ncbi:MAG: helix-hairpin-helix domain-containing protein [Stenotrophomonas sp.]
MKLFTVMLKSLVLALLLTTSAQATEKVDINTASAAELDQVLVNVGPAKAQAIVEHRQANGPFKSVEELALVKGIGLKTVERNRDLIEVRAGAAPTHRKPATTATVKPVERR